MQHPVEIARQEIFEAALGWHHCSLDPKLYWLLPEKTAQLHHAVEAYLAAVNALIGRTT